MAGKYLIDTNTAIDYLNNKLSVKVADLIDIDEVNMSVITRMELLAWPNATEGDLNLLNNFIGDAVIFGLDEPIILKGITVRKQFKLKLPDAIIAATALVYNLTLFSRNLSDFKNIPELVVINPWEM